jgi:hypothetical protein
MTDATIISYHDHYFDAAAALYEHAYAIPPMEGRTGYDISRDVIQGHIKRDSFIGVLAVTPSQEVIGMAWGYDTPADNTRMTRIVEKRMGKQWIEQTFMVEAFAMRFDRLSEELAAQLHDGLAKRVAEEDFQRMRMRLNMPRLDGLPDALYAQGWEKLDGLAHVIWLGKTL